MAFAVALGQEHGVIKQWGKRGQEVAAELDGLLKGGMSREHLGYFLSALVDQSHNAQEAQEDLEVVWTGPEGPSAQTRDTLVTVRQLLEGAEKHVLVASFVFYDMAELMKPLCQRMVERPQLEVTVVANVSRRSDHGEVGAQTALESFKAGFLKQWPGSRFAHAIL